MDYRTIIKVDFREYDRRTLEKSREWFKDPELRKLTVTPEIDIESQEKWFLSLKDRKDYFIKSVWRDNEPIAVIGIKSITPIDGEVWGYIGEKKYWGKAIGIDMMNFILDYAASIGLSSVYSKSLKSNLATYKINRRFGFIVEKELEDGKILMRYYIKQTAD